MIETGDNTMFSSPTETYIDLAASSPPCPPLITIVLEKDVNIHPRLPIVPFIGNVLASPNAVYILVSFMLSEFDLVLGRVY